MAERRVGSFVLDGKLGSGGMGVVYRATYTKTGQQVALKMLPPEGAQDDKMRARFDRELKIMKKLKHPHIVQCYGGATQGAQRYYAMELIEGGSLSELLQDRGRLDWNDVIRYGIEICEALDFAHENGIIHRDIKPSNLLLTADDRIKLTDFGIARDQQATALTADGRTVGTFAYMAPEQIRGENSISPRTDLYALGCVLFELLTGQTPFQAESPTRMFFQHLEQPPPRVSSIALDCPIWLENLVARLLEKDPLQRPFDASAVQMGLQEVLDKVRDQASVSQHSVDGGPSNLSAAGDAQVVRKLLQKKKKKKKETGPFYERTWFLSGCLAAVMLIVTFAFWPMSEDKLFQKAEVLMATEDAAQWDTARTQFIEPLQRKFPNSRHADKLQGFIDKIEMGKAERRIDWNAKLGRTPASEGERLFTAARKYEQFGDRVTALERYRDMLNLMQDKVEERPYVNLARRQIERIVASGGDKDQRLEIINAALKRAEDLYAQGKVLEAQNIWNSIINLYGTNRELRPQVKLARSRIKDKDKDEDDEDAAAPVARSATVPGPTLPRETSAARVNPQP